MTLRQSVQQGYTLYTTNHVVGETYTLLVVTHGVDAGRLPEAAMRTGNTKR